MQPTQIEAWARLRGIHLDLWQLEAIERMDSVRLQLLSEKTPSEAGQSEPVSERPLSTRLFDALFPTRKK